MDTRCPHCKAALEVLRALRDTDIDCPLCGREFTVKHVWARPDGHAEDHPPCRNHPDLPAEVCCDTCGDFFCEECCVEIEGQQLCPACRGETPVLDEEEDEDEPEDEEQEEEGLTSTEKVLDTVTNLVLASRNKAKHPLAKAVALICIGTGLVAGVGHRFTRKPEAPPTPPQAKQPDQPREKAPRPSAATPKSAPKRDVAKTDKASGAKSSPPLTRDAVRNAFAAGRGYTGMLRRTDDNAALGINLLLVSVGIDEDKPKLILYDSGDLDRTKRYLGEIAEGKDGKVTCLLRGLSRSGSEEEDTPAFFKHGERPELSITSATAEGLTGATPDGVWEFTLAPDITRKWRSKSGREAYATIIAVDDDVALLQKLDGTVSRNRCRIFCKAEVELFEMLAKLGAYPKPDEAMKDTPGQRADTGKEQ